LASICARSYGAVQNSCSAPTRYCIVESPSGHLRLLQHWISTASHIDLLSPLHAHLGLVSISSNSSVWPAAAQYMKPFAEIE
jgi:hypothetical protein